MLGLELAEYFLGIKRVISGKHIDAELKHVQPEVRAFVESHGFVHPHADNLAVALEARDNFWSGATRLDVGALVPQIGHFGFWEQVLGFPSV